MLSLDLFNSRYEQELREGAVDDLEYRRMNDLRDKMEYLMQAYKKADSKEARDAIMKRYNEYKSEREGYLKIREQQVPSRQDPFAYVKPEPRGIGDIQDPRQKMAQLTQKSKKGPLANVGAGLKGFLTGKQEPMDEQDYKPTKPMGKQSIGRTAPIQQAPRAYGVGNFQRLVKANMSNRPYVDLEFPNAQDNMRLDQRGLDLISDYYDGLENDQAKNHFIYRVLPSADEVRSVLTKLGYTVSQQQQLPLEEKKKSKAQPDLKAGDIKVARELQKLRAQYPAAQSDVEAVARAEIDSTERSQQQLASIRGANEKQDALLKQLVALDQEQGREIDDLDKENNSLEQRLAQVQATNDRLQSAVGQMTGTKKTARGQQATPARPAVEPAVIDILPGAAADAEPASKPGRRGKAKSTPMSHMAKQIIRLPKDAPGTAKKAEPVKDKDADDQEDLAVKYPTIKSTRPTVAANPDQFQLVGEHGGGIGPRQHWQSLMREQGRPPMDTINYYFPDINAQSDVEAIRAAIREIVNNPELSKTSKQRLLGQVGMMVQRNRALIGREWRQYLDRFSESVQETFAMPGTTIPRKSIIQGYTVFFNPETRTVSVTRGGDSEEAAIEQARIGTVNLKTFRNTAERLIDKIDDQIINEGVRDMASATAVISCLLTGGGLSGCATAPQQTTAQQVLKTGQDIGRTVQTAKKITRAGVEQEVQQEIMDLARASGGDPGAANTSNILRIWRKIKARPPVPAEPQAPEYGPAEPRRRMPQNEAREINSKEDFVKERDRLMRMISIESDPANKQILRSAIRQLEGQAENEGWITLQQRMIREDNASNAAEQAILKRIFVAHRDLLIKYGPQKVMQAAEEVAYNVGDQEIGSSDVSGWVRQVEYILGARS